MIKQNVQTKRRVKTEEKLYKLDSEGVQREKERNDGAGIGIDRGGIGGEGKKEKDRARRDRWRRNRGEMNNQEA